MNAHSRGVALETLTWVEAEEALKETRLVVIPLGASCKEHGPHLQLKNDWLIAEYLRDRVLECAEAVVLPTVGYHYYPAFVEYPGSVTLRLETARDLIVDICTSLAAFGPRRFYVINTGISTVRALAPAAEILAKEGIGLQYTDLHAALAPVEEELQEQEGGSHADEIETSLMLHIAPHTVSMAKAVKDYQPGQGQLTRQKGGKGVYSPSGVWGDATLANAAKGKRIAQVLSDYVLAEIAALSRA